MCAYIFKINVFIIFYLLVAIYLKFSLTKNKYQIRKKKKKTQNKAKETLS